MVGISWAMKDTSNKNNMQIANATPKTQRIACRICEQIFSTPQTLISHIESSHMKNDLTTLPSSSRKPLSFTQNLLSSSSCSSSSAAAASLASNYPNPFLYQNLYKFPTWNNIDLNHYRNHHYNYGRFQNGFLVGAPPQPAALQFPARNNFAVGPPMSQQMPFSPVQQGPAMAREASDSTLPLLHQLEQRRLPEISVAYKNKSVSNSIDLTLKL